MGKRSKQVERMIEGYMSKRQKGMSNKQIADSYAVSEVTLYKYLQEIAENNGVTRESLLCQPPKQENIELENLFEGILERLDMLIKEMDRIIEEQEEKNGKN